MNAWKDAFQKEYRKRAKELKNLKQKSERDQFDRKGSELQIWLEAALAQVHNFIAIIPTCCRDLRLKQFCLEDIAPAVLIILIAHIIVAVRWMLIKILSLVIRIP